MSDAKKKTKNDIRVYLDEEFDWPEPPKVIIQTGHCSALDEEDNTIFTNHSEALIHYGNYINHLNTIMRSITRTLLKGHKLLFAKVEEVLDEVKGIKKELHTLDDRVSVLEECTDTRAKWWSGLGIEIRRSIITGIVGGLLILLGWGSVAVIKDIAQQNTHTPVVTHQDILEELQD